MSKSTLHKNKIITIILSLICFVLLASSITLAWFTSRKTLKDTLEFGTITVDVTTNYLVSITTTRTSGLLMPGDTVEVKFNVENKGEPAYYLTVVSLDGVETYSGFESLVGVYAGDIQTDINTDGVPDNKVVTKLDEITEGTTKKVGSITKVGEIGSVISNERTFIIDFETTRNEFKNKEISITVSVFAIQQANITESFAFNELVKVMQAG